MFSKKTVCFVTGSSRGLGKSIATTLAPKLIEGSVIVLLARSEGDLEAVKHRLLETSPHVTAIVRAFDQSKQEPQLFETLFSQTFQVLGQGVEDFQQAVFIHNAASIQPTQFVRNLPPVQELTHYVNTNLSGVVALTTEFLKYFPVISSFSRVVINISSLAALQPMKSWAMYCSGKAARDMFFKVLAAEEKGVRVLNYAPGPLVTDMTDTIINDSEDESIRKWMTDVKSQNKLLTCDASAARLMEILQKNTFESGSHVDYYDKL